MKNSKPISSIVINDTCIQKGTEIFYARIIPQVGMCYVQALKVRTIYEDIIIGVDSVTKNVQVIDNKLIGVSAFTIRKQADKLVKNAQKSGKIRIFTKGEEE